MLLFTISCKKEQKENVESQRDEPFVAFQYHIICSRYDTNIIEDLVNPSHIVTLYKDKVILKRVCTSKEFNLVVERKLTDFKGEDLALLEKLQNLTYEDCRKMATLTKEGEDRSLHNKIIYDVVFFDGKKQKMATIYLWNELYTDISQSMLNDLVLIESAYEKWLKIPALNE